MVILKNNKIIAKGSAAINILKFCYLFCNIERSDDKQREDHLNFVESNYRGIYKVRSSQQSRKSSKR